MTQPQTFPCPRCGAMLQLGELACRNCGEEKWRYESELGKNRHGEFCSRECWNKYRWRRGIAISADVVSIAGHFVSARTRQRWKGRWGGHKAPTRGARPRGRPRAEFHAEQVTRVRQLHERGFGRRTIAKIEAISERRVRAILSEPA